MSGTIPMSDSRHMPMPERHPNLSERFVFLQLELELPRALAVHANPTVELDYGEMAERATNDFVCSSTTEYITP